jgi:hypothetical protein
MVWGVWGVWGGGGLLQEQIEEMGEVFSRSKPVVPAPPLTSGRAEGSQSPADVRRESKQIPEDIRILRGHLVLSFPLETFLNCPWKMRKELGLGLNW